MSRYLYEGMLRDAAAGKGVVFVSRGSDVRHTFHGCARLVEDSSPGAGKVFRANGQERITFESGGWVRFLRRGGNGYRGVTADVVVIGEDMDDPDEVLAMLGEVGEFVPSRA